jgi:hypothetical protein
MWHFSRVMTARLVFVGLAVFVARTAAAQDLIPFPDRTATPVVRHITDPRTGLILSLSRTGPHTFVVEVADESVSIRKLLSPTASVTTLRGSDDFLQVSIDAADVTVSSRTETVSLSSVTIPSLERLTAIVSGSRAAQAAQRLLTRLDLRLDSVTGNALLLTRAFLELSAGTMTAVGEYQHWVHDTASRPRIRLAVSVPAGGPAECWDTYEAYLLTIQNDYFDCMSAVRWYNLTGPAQCAFTWTLRAELAMAWALGCGASLPTR